MQYYKFLYWLVHTQQPEISVELGVELGLASAHMASAARKYGGQVVGIDHHFHHVPGEEINKIYGNYHFCCADSVDMATIDEMQVFVEKYGPIGVLFQDSSHHYESSIQEWEAYSPMLSADAIWICDDITDSFHDPLVDPFGKGMVQYFEDLPGIKLLFPDVLHRGNTMGIILL